MASRFPDEVARITPYEVGIPGREFARERFGAIRDEAEGRGVDASDLEAFVQLGEVGRTLRLLQGEERGGAALRNLSSFLYHAFHFHEAGERLTLVSTELVRHLISSGEGGAGWQGKLADQSGYIQLPGRLFWSHPDPSGPAEDLDGIFWATTENDTLHLLIALGLRADRPGISLIPLPGVPLADAPAWGAARIREEGEDFRTTLPGGELDELYSLVAAGEVLKLVARVFGYVWRRPEALREPTSPDPSADPPDEVPRTSTLPFRRLVLLGG
ncbi:MAG: hypothetical protein WD960_06605 [Gemmatimonadota bacterium]